MPNQFGNLPQYGLPRRTSPDGVDVDFGYAGIGFGDPSPDEVYLADIPTSGLDADYDQQRLEQAVIEFLGPKQPTVSNTWSKTVPPNEGQTAQHSNALPFPQRQIPINGFGSGHLSVSSMYPSPEDAHTPCVQPYGDQLPQQFSGSFTNDPPSDAEGTVIGLDTSPYSASTQYAIGSGYPFYQTAPDEQQYSNDGSQLYNHEFTAETPLYDNPKSERSRSAKYGRTKESYQELRIQAKSVKCEEEKCKRRFRLTQPDMMRLCKRHRDKFNRNNAGPPIFFYRNDIRSFEDAYNRVYSMLEPMNLENDDVDFNNNEDHWMNEFIAAANTPYVGGSKYHEFHARQQTVYNGKATDQKLFNSEVVNVRMRFLYQAAYRLHVGDKNDVYPKGGDNHGYGEGYETMIFSERLEKIIKYLKLDKRVCLDVIEGRGVNAFVRYPERYEKRKTQNKDSNEKKQKKQKLGDKVQDIRKAKGKNVEDSDVDSEDCSDLEDDAEENEDQAAAAAFNTPASLNRPLDANAEYVPRTAPPQPAGGKRKRQMPSRKATAPTPRQSKKAKTILDETKGQDAPTATTNRAAQPVEDEQVIEGLDEPLFADLDDDGVNGLVDQLIWETSDPLLDSSGYHC